MSTQTSVNEDEIKKDDSANENIPTLSSVEKDTLGEIGNISMGTCATTLSTLLGKRVVITTPQVSVCTEKTFFDEYEKPVIATEISYTKGLDGNNILLMKKEDAVLISDLLMGSDSSERSEEENKEILLSVISEVMNQMVGSSSTALADILQAPVNISPPSINEVTKDGRNIEELYFGDEPLIKISFKMEIEDLLSSSIMQMMPFDFGKNLVDTLLAGGDTGQKAVTPKPETQAAPEPAAPAPAPAAPAPAPAATSEPAAAPEPIAAPEVVEEQAPRQAVAHAPEPVRQQPVQPVINKDQRRVDIKAAKYQSFDDPDAINPVSYTGAGQHNIDLIIDVPLQVTVVLGKSKKSIKEILDLGMGSVIVLDRLAGELVDVLVNGKLFAHGEVVVIEDNYGVRITEIVSTVV